jgi:hypothetical protein
MSSQHSGDMIDANAYSVDELREAVFEGRGRVSRPLALALLTRKDYPNKVADLQKILLDEAEQPRLRALAATGLGQIQTPASLRALERGLESREGVTLRGVAKALANVGGRKHVASLEELSRSAGPVGVDARRALNVLTDRLRAAAPTERGDIPTVPVRSIGDLTQIRVSAATAGDVQNAIKTLPNRKLAKRGAVSLQCEGRQLVFVFDEPALGRGLDMTKRDGDVGIVAEPPGIEGIEWSARYRVSIDPQGRDAFAIVVATYDGRPILAGSGRRQDKEATFELAAADVPGALPVEIRGRFDGRKLTFDQARSALRRQPSRTPAAEG